MFSAASKLFKYLAGGDDDPGGDEVPQHVISDDGCSESKEWNFTGKVSSVHGAYGMIDEEVYFAFDSLDGSVMPEVGATVDVVAKRKHGMGGWKATRVRLIEQGPGVKADDWDQEVETPCGDIKTSDDTERYLHFTALVTAEIPGGGILDDRIPYMIADVTHEGYTPCRGDWVTAKQSQEGSTGDTQATDIRPLRMKSFEGVINSVHNRSHGYIDGDIYFSWQACRDFEPRRSDNVNGEALEVSGGKIQWRAFIVRKVYPDLDTSAILRSPIVRQAPTFHHGLQGLLENKEGLEVTQLDFGQMKLGSKRTLTMFIRNSKSSHTLLQCVLRGSSSQFTLEEPRLEVTGQSTSQPSKQHAEVKELCIGPGRAAIVTAQCHAINLGQEERLIVLDFESFKIGRQMKVSVIDSGQRELDPSAPYSRQRGQGRVRPGPQGDDTWVVPGQRPIRSRTSMQLPQKLAQFPVPPALRQWLEEDKDITQLVPALGQPLSLDGYTRRFSALLHLEELQMEEEMREFDIEWAVLQPYFDYLELEVPGLSEGRPSLLVGDRVVLSSPHRVQQGPVYEGFIHEVRRDSILLKFHDKFHESYQGGEYYVTFNFNRTPLRRCHKAVDLVTQLGTQVLFPNQFIPKISQTKLSRSGKVKETKVKVIPVKPNVGIRHCPLGGSTCSPSKNHEFFNSTLNDRQRAAVLRILNGQCRPTPYVLFGPPGTGKTITVVEAVLQVFHHLPYSRIITCTPSNSAADLLAERLHQSGRVKVSEMIRLNAFSRQQPVPECIAPYCSDGEDIERASRCRILICTCTSVGMMYALGLNRGHYTHVFIDEAGQATEPETMIPIGLITGTDGQVVLAGDPMQLGPVLRSQFAKDLGMNLSFLERLSLREPYQRNGQRFSDHGNYDPLLVTKLVKNYRSHPAILSVPSGLFYHGELEVSADPTLIHSLCSWNKLPNTDNFPVIFHGIRGQDMREGNSPSWFNPMEALQVMRYLRALVGNDLRPLSWDDVGVITPYRKQVRCIMVEDGAGLYRSIYQGVKCKVLRVAMHGYPDQAMGDYRTKVEKIRLLIDKLSMEEVKVGSVEEFQGQERLVMIITTVRSSDSEIGQDVRHNLGFLSNPKRFNVAVTRAQALLIVIGNPHVLAQDPCWRTLLQYCVTNLAYTGCDLPTSIIPCDTPQEASIIPCDTPQEASIIPCDTAQETSTVPCDTPQETDNISLDTQQVMNFAAPATPQSVDNILDDTVSSEVIGQSSSDDTDTGDTVFEVKGDNYKDMSPSSTDDLDKLQQLSPDTTPTDVNLECQMPEVKVQSSEDNLFQTEYKVDDFQGQTSEVKVKSFSNDFPVSKVSWSLSEQLDDKVQGSSLDAGEMSDNKVKGHSQLREDDTTKQPDNHEKPVALSQVVDSLDEDDNVLPECISSRASSCLVDTASVAETFDAIPPADHRPTCEPTRNWDPMKQTHVKCNMASFSTEQYSVSVINKPTCDKLLVASSECLRPDHDTDLETGTMKSDHAGSQGGSVNGEICTPAAEGLESSVTGIEKAFSVMEMSVSTEDGNAFTVEKDSVTVENKSVTVEKESVTVEKESVTVEKESATVEKDSVTVEKEGVPTIKNTSDLPNISSVASIANTHMDHTIDSYTMKANAESRLIDITGMKLSENSSNISEFNIASNNQISVVERSTSEENQTGRVTGETRTDGVDVCAPSLAEFQVLTDTHDEITALRHNRSTRKPNQVTREDKEIILNKSYEDVLPGTSPADGKSAGACCSMRAGTVTTIESSGRRSPIVQQVDRVLHVQHHLPGNTPNQTPDGASSSPMISKSPQGHPDDRRSPDIDVKRLVESTSSSSSAQMFNRPARTHNMTSPTSDIPSSPLLNSPGPQNTLHPLQGNSQTKLHPLQGKIIRQVEYYFGDLNLPRDQFLLDLIDCHSEQYVPISTLMTFKRMQTLTLDMKVIADALRKSTSGLLEVHSNGALVRRSPQRPLPTDMDQWKLDIKSRAVAVEGLAVNIDIDCVHSLFESLGSVEHVERGIRKYMGNRTLAYADLVIFASASGAQKAARDGRRMFYRDQLTFYYRDKLSNFCVNHFFRKRILPNQGHRFQGQRHHQGQGQHEGHGHVDSEKAAKRAALEAIMSSDIKWEKASKSDRKKEEQIKSTSSSMNVGKDDRLKGGQMKQGKSDEMTRKSGQEMTVDMNWGKTVSPQQQTSPRQHTSLRQSLCDDPRAPSPGIPCVRSYGKGRGVVSLMRPPSPRGQMAQPVTMMTGGELLEDVLISSVRDSLQTSGIHVTDPIDTNMENTIIESIHACNKSRTPISHDQTVTTTNQRPANIHISNMAPKHTTSSPDGTTTATARTPDSLYCDSKLLDPEVVTSCKQTSLSEPSRSHSQHTFTSDMESNVISSEQAAMGSAEGSQSRPTGRSPRNVKSRAVRYHGNNTRATNKPKRSLRPKFSPIPVSDLDLDHMICMKTPTRPDLEATANLCYNLSPNREFLSEKAFVTRGQQESGVDADFEEVCLRVSKQEVVSKQVVPLGEGHGSELRSNVHPLGGGAISAGCGEVIEPQTAHGIEQITIGQYDLNLTSGHAHSAATVTHQLPSYNVIPGTGEYPNDGQVSSSTSRNSPEHIVNLTGFMQKHTDETAGKHTIHAQNQSKLIDFPPGVLSSSAIGEASFHDREIGEQVFSLRSMSYRDREMDEQVKSTSFRDIRRDDDSSSSDDTRDHYCSLEQRDSDVIIESSDEEILENDYVEKNPITEKWS